MSSGTQNGTLSSIDYDRFLNSVAIRRQLSPLRGLWRMQAAGGPSMISLGTGTPNTSCFPFQSICACTRDGRRIMLEGEELDIALGYNDSRGYQPLVDWLVALQKRIHDPPYARNNPDLNQLVVTAGSEDGQCKILEMVLEPGDPVLIAEPAYPGSLAALRPLGVEFMLIESDSDGVNPKSMEKLLRQYYQQGGKPSEGKRRPKLLIIQSNHCNPTGVSTGLERLKEIYRLACEYDLLIVEDDPYYFLTYGAETAPAAAGENHPPLRRGLLSLDTEGRVLRLGSFSKTVSGGMRLGTLSGPRPLVDRVVMHTAASSLHANTLSQVILFKFLSDLGQDGFLEHVKAVAAFYQRQCRVMLKAARLHLTGIAEWNEPQGGMFLWIKVPGVKDTKKLIMEKGTKKSVILAPGSFFMCDESKSTSYLRASYSWASEQEINEGFRRLAEIIREETEAS